MSLRRIVYIEDDKNEAEVISRLYRTVQKKFHGETDFVSANSWGDGAALVDSIKPDVVIVDLALLPDSDTEHTLASLAKVATLWPPILVLTGNKYDLTLRRRCLELGIDDFMLKDDAHHGGCEMLVERVYHCYLRRQYRDGRRS